MSPRIRRKLAIALVLVTIILVIPPAHANDPCAMSCQYQFDLCMYAVQECATAAYNNYQNCLQTYPGGSDQSGVCNYNYWVDSWTCEFMMHDCNYGLDFCLTSCQ